MKISIYPLAKSIPKNKEEKRRESFKCSSPNVPVVIDVFSHEDLMSTLLHNAWSPSIFNGCRSNDNFISTDFMVLDIDQGLTINEASDRFFNLNLDHIIMPTASHTKENHRFRLVLPLAQTIADVQTFDSTWNYLKDIIPELDNHCSDVARFFFACREEDSVFFDDGELLEPVYLPEQKTYDINDQITIPTIDMKDKDVLEILYDKIPKNIPESIHHFLINAESGMLGEWNGALNAATFTLALQGIHISNIITAFEKIAPYDLDDKDMNTIKNAFKRGNDIRDTTPPVKKHLI